MKKKTPVASTAKKASPTPLQPFDKYLYYLNSVQSPDENMAFLRTIYLDQRGVVPPGLTLREDFCGTFANSCSWVKLGPSYVAHGIDLDPEPIAYGREHYLPELPAEARARVHITEGDVLESPLAKCDLAAALNFSFCFFRERAVLKRYFTRVFESLNEGGVFVLDVMGGPFYQETNEHELELDEPTPFSYFLEQESFDPITCEARFHIHFKRKGEPKRKKVFSYTFRMWALPELRDLLLECGFKSVDCYWEGTLDDGEGNGIWSRMKHGEDCDSWLAYLAATR